jgi:hypothetical protein
MKCIVFSSFAFLAVVEAGIPKPEILVSSTTNPLLLLDVLDV